MTTEIPEQVYRDAWGAAVDVQTDEPIDLPQEERDRNADMFMGSGFRAAVESAYRAGEGASPGGPVLILTRQEFGATVYGLLTPGQRAEISYLHNTLKADHHEGCAAHGESTSCCVDTMTGTERTS